MPALELIDSLNGVLLSGAILPGKCAVVSLEVNTATNFIRIKGLFDRSESAEVQLYNDF